MGFHQLPRPVQHDVDLPRCVFKFRLGDHEEAAVGRHIIGPAGSDGVVKQVIRAAFMADVIQGADVGMVEAGDGTSLAFESLPQIRIAGQFRGQDLDCTVRLRRVSRALYTSPMPPAPSALTIS